MSSMDSWDLQLQATRDRERIRTLERDLSALRISNGELQTKNGELEIENGELRTANANKDKLIAHLGDELRLNINLSRRYSDLQKAKTETDQAYTVVKESLTRVFSSAEYSDLKIRCGSMTLDVHRAIICPRSTFFAAACRESSGLKEPHTAIIDLGEEDPDAVQMMVHYLYHFDYPIADAGKSVPIITSQLHDKVYPIFDTDTSVPDMTPQLHAKVYTLGERYGMPRLKDLARNKFNDAIQADVRPDPLLDGVIEAYTSTVDTDRGLRDLAVGAVFGRADLLDSNKFQEKIQAIPQLNMDLLILYRKQQKVV